MIGMDVENISFLITEDEHYSCMVFEK